MIEVAKNSEHPRSYEVVGTLMKQLSDMNQQLLDVHQQKQKLSGTEKTKGSLSKLKGNSIDKASKILNQLESKEDKKTKLVSEEMIKMKDLISYNRKTQ